MKKDNNDGLSNGDEGQYDYTVLVLADTIGERTGWLGTRRYTDAWDTNPNWWHIGYPQDLTSVARPTYQRGFTMNGDDNQDDSHEALYHQADVSQASPAPCSASGRETSGRGPSPSSRGRTPAPTVPAAAATWSTWRSVPGTTTLAARRPAGRALHQGASPHGRGRVAGDGRRVLDCTRFAQRRLREPIPMLAFQALTTGSTR